MPSLLDIRRRIRAVKSTQQITKAMKMVAASKLRRAQERIQHARPYAHADAAGARTASRRAWIRRRIRCSTSGRRRRPGGRALLIVITADRGLCGSFNTNVIKAASTFITEGNVAARRAGAGRTPGPRLFRAARLRQAATSGSTCSHSCATRTPGRSRAAAIEAFVNGEVDSVHLVYNEFKSVMQQRVVVERLLPIPRLEIAASEPQAAPPVDYLYEPAPEALFAHLIPVHVEVQVFRALLESNAAVLRRADDRDGRRDAELGRDDREPDAVHEQGAAGGDHARDHRSGQRRAGALTVGSRGSAVGSRSRQ